MKGSAHLPRVGKMNRRIRNKIQLRALSPEERMTRCRADQSDADTDGGMGLQEWAPERCWCLRWGGGCQGLVPSSWALVLFLSVFPVCTETLLQEHGTAELGKRTFQPRESWSPKSDTIQGQGLTEAHAEGASCFRLMSCDRSWEDWLLGRPRHVSNVWLYLCFCPLTGPAKVKIMSFVEFLLSPSEMRFSDPWVGSVLWACTDRVPGGRRHGKYPGDQGASPRLAPDCLHDPEASQSLRPEQGSKAGERRRRRVPCLDITWVTWCLLAFVQTALFRGASARHQCPSTNVTTRSPHLQCVCGLCYVPFKVLAGRKGLEQAWGGVGGTLTPNHGLWGCLWLRVLGAWILFAPTLH